MECWLMGPVGTTCRSLLVAVSVFAVLSCGDGDTPSESARSDRAAVERTVLAYFDALEHADGERACEQLTSAMQARVRALSEAASCAEGLEAVARYVPDADKVFASVSVKSVALDGDRAEVTVDAQVEEYESRSKDADRGSLERVDGDWKIAKLPRGTSRPNPLAQCLAGGLDSFDQGTASPYWRQQGRNTFFKYLKRFCRRFVREGADPDAARRIGSEVLRDMIERGELPPPG
jgi:hypothetical protein